jgi:lipopolysaccharide/colanic/teichoic acid biosynthesis glycosyltransferase
MSDERATFKLRASPYLSVDATAVRALMGRTATLRRPQPKSFTPAADDVQAPPRLDADTITRLAANEVLSRELFLRELDREKRRADRSKSPLSIVRWHVHTDDQNRSGAMELVAILNASRRDTDVVGELSHDGVAMLLPGTGSAGASVFVRKVAERARGLRISQAVTTYPDDAFARIASGEAVVDEAADLLDDIDVPQRRLYDALKRIIDVVLTLAILVALAPLMIATAIAVAATSRGPVIFRQTRLGKGCVPFDFYKFRSMHQSNDDRIHREFVASLIQGKHDAINQQSPADPLFKIKNDPRITRVGRFIRSTSIDELPQLFNVLKGDMSLVGPRPPLAYEAKHYQSWHLRRILVIRPGITGLWQVEGRSRVTFDEMVRMDLRYIKQRSLALDLKLLVRTVAVVVARQGAK